MSVEQSDERLIAEAISVGGRAFGELFDRHSRAVYLYVWGLAGDAGDAEDITQDVFETAWRKLGAIRLVDSSVLPWLLVTAKYSWRNHERRKAHRRSEQLDESALDPRSSVQTSSSAEELHWVRLEIGKLSAIDQQICNLCLIDGYSYKEAARTVGLSPGAIAKRVERLRTHLRATVRSES